MKLSKIITLFVGCIMLLTVVCNALDYAVINSNTEDLDSRAADPGYAIIDSKPESTDSAVIDPLYNMTVGFYDDDKDGDRDAIIVRESPLFIQVELLRNESICDELILVRQEISDEKAKSLAIQKHWYLNTEKLKVGSPLWNRNLGDQLLESLTTPKPRSAKVHTIQQFVENIFQHFILSNNLNGEIVKADELLLKMATESLIKKNPSDDLIPAFPYDDGSNSFPIISDNSDASSDSLPGVTDELAPPGQVPIFSSGTQSFTIFVPTNGISVPSVYVNGKKAIPLTPLLPETSIHAIDLNSQKGINLNIEVDIEVNGTNVVTGDFLGQIVGSDIYISYDAEGNRIFPPSN